MTESFNGAMKVNVQGTLTASQNLGSASYNLNQTYAINLLQGTGANQADIIFANTYTIAASGTQTLDLNGVLLDAHGNTINMTLVKGIFVYAYAANTNNVLVGGAGANAFFTWCDANTSKVTVRPGGFMLLGCQDATGYAVTAGTGDLLQLANSSSGTSVQCDVVIIGVQ